MEDLLPGLPAVTTPHGKPPDAMPKAGAAGRQSLAVHRQARRPLAAFRTCMVAKAVAFVFHPPTPTA
jgi:hypothetical protein